MNSLLENIYRRLLRESREEEASRESLVAKLERMTSDGLGVLVKKGSQFSDISIVIYKTNVFVGNALAALDTESGSGGDAEAIQAAAETSIVGMLGMDPTKDPCNGAWQVSYIAGKGYSDVLHAIAMQASPTGAIMPDRGAVADKLVGTYKKMLTRGPGRPTPLDNKMNPKTPDTGDDCEVWADEDPSRSVLDNSFSGGEGNLEGLKKNHAETMRLLTRHLEKYMGWSPEDINELLSDVSGLFFTAAYSKVPESEKGLKRNRTTT